MTRGPTALLAAALVLSAVALEAKADFRGFRTGILGNTVTACTGDGLVCAASLGPAQAGGGERTGAGVAVLSLDSAAATIAFEIQIGGLSVPEVAAHIHGPAGPGVPAPVLYGLPLGSLKEGVIELRDIGSYTVADQIADLNAGQWYVNVHTLDEGGNGFPLGEIRGQISLATIPQTIAGQPSSAAAWRIDKGSLRVVRRSSDLFLVRARVRGLVLDFAGFNPSPDFLVRLFCHDERGDSFLAATTRSAPLSLGNPDPTAMTPGGDGRLRDFVRLPDLCFAPIALIGGTGGPTGTSPGNWFAVGGF